ncbi:MAG TPA: hypothetical protein VGQ81_03035 [Acidobacteriota bacterium]|jgi:hypothetical protein|nr:hypothetical protein [Acidobacteriota bacterium]
MLNRRRFFEKSALAVAGATLGGLSTARAQKSQAVIGIQVGAISFVDEGTEKVLDGFQEMAGVNTLFLATFTYGRGIAGRQPRPQPLPDHGKQEYDDNFHGGNFATPHPAYYRNTSIKPEKAPDHPNYDVIADVLPASHRRNMKVICWFEDVFRKDVPGLDKALEIDLHGKPTMRTCMRNPNTRNFWLGLVEDYLRSYDVDGLMWGSERQGPLNNALGASHGGGATPGTVGCFCNYCLEAARKEGINAERARQGFLAIERWIAEMKGGKRPTDGAFVTFWRTLVNHPEVLAWERLWDEGLRDTYGAMYRHAHSLKPEKPMGWHLWHNNSFSPFYRGEQDYAEFSKYSDYLKVVMYNNCGGPRMAQYVRNVNSTLFADLTPEQTLEFTFRVQQYPNEKSLDRIFREGLSADYVLRETRRAVAGVGPNVKIWPGIDIDIPTGQNDKKTEPEDVYQAVKAAFNGGAHGVILSRKYSEMKLANLRAAGRAVRELKLA